MRTGRPKEALNLTREERDRLQSMAHRARSQPLLARRARVVLACGDGLDNQAVARKLRASLGMVGKWRANRDRARRARSAMSRWKRSLYRRWKVRREGRRTGARADWRKRADSAA